MKKEFEPARNPIAEAPVDPPRKQPDDATLRAAVALTLQTDGRIAGESIDVAVVNGCALLTGSVSTEFHRVLADACASSVPGILVIQNQLMVLQQGPFARRPG